MNRFHTPVTPRQCYGIGPSDGRRVARSESRGVTKRGALKCHFGMLRSIFYDTNGDTWTPTKRNSKKANQHIVCFVKKWFDSNWWNFTSSKYHPESPTHHRTKTTNNTRLLHGVLTVMSPWKAMPGPATKTAGTATAGRVGFSHGPLVGWI